MSMRTQAGFVRGLLDDTRDAALQEPATAETALPVLRTAATPRWSESQPATARPTPLMPNSDTAGVFRCRAGVSYVVKRWDAAHRAGRQADIATSATLATNGPFPAGCPATMTDVTALKR